MIHPVYTQTSSVSSVNHSNGYSVISSDLVPLIKTKYLSEFKTELEKAKVRKNLGISDDQSLLWGHIDGVIEDLKDLMNYIDIKWSYSSDLSDTIIDIKSGLDYAIEYVSTFKSDSDSIEKSKQDIININNIIDNELIPHLTTHDNDVIKLGKDIDRLLKLIELLNNDLETINVDPNILNWISNSMSNTVKYTDGSILVSLSSEEYNAVLDINGLYVKDYTQEITDLLTGLSNNLDAITNLQETSNIYNPGVPSGTTSPHNTGGIQSGTSVDDLKGKNISEILDAILFPAHVEELQYPRVSYSYIPTLVKVGSSVVYPDLIFTKGHAGSEINRLNILTFNGSEATDYSLLGVYTFTGTINYNEGNKLINNRGEVTDLYIPAGSVSTTLNVTTTYPWYYGTDSLINEYPTLTPFNTNSGKIEVTLSNKSIIKLPGANTQLLSFLVDGGLGGFLDVNLDAWDKSEELINGITYKVFLKLDAYTSDLKHLITFKLLV